jgi:predicted transcriptional regulator
MTLSEHAQKLLAKIQRKNKTGPVVIDDLIEFMSFADSDRLIADIQELRKAGLITVESIKHKGRFGTELILTDGHVQHGIVQAKLSKMIVKVKRK